tara:strand:+ start:8237 stop:9559 length:1323 start_codon:yes stop_codon:yes gene_type:complete
MDLTENELQFNSKEGMNSIKHVDNLFIISNLGQLNHISALISHYGFRNCGLIVLFTSANLIVPKDLQNSLNSSLFNYTFFLEIPRSSNRINLTLTKKLYEKYSYYLSIFRPKCLFILSFQYHYSLLGQIAYDIGADLNLVEEGLGTYRLVNPEERVLEKEFNLSVIKRAAKKTLTKTQLFKLLYSRYKPFKEFAIQTKSFVKEVYESPELQAKLIRSNHNKKLRAILFPHTTFNNTYTSFPSITGNIFKAESHKFYPVFSDPKKRDIESALDIIETYGIRNNDYIYISQKFSIDSDEYVFIVEEVFKKFLKDSEGRIFIKTHPKRESQATIDAFMKLEEFYEGKICLIKESNFLIEEVVRQSNVKGVIGITSSALVYAPIVSEDCTSYSLAKILLEKLKEKPENLKGINMITSHLSMIENFENVIFLKDNFLEKFNSSLS